MIDSVDVIIPTFMETERLAEAVVSCRKQTHPPQKIFVVDDGSNQETQVWLKENYSSDPQIQLILAPHTSLPGVARSIGIEASSAKWLAFLDADDSWDEKKLELQITYARNNNAEFVATNAIAKSETQPDVLLLNNIPERIKFQDLVSTNWIINSSVLVRSSLLKGKKKYATDIRVRAVEDYATWLRIATETDLHILPEPLTYYRVSAQSIRSGDVVDPRIYAFADFLIWASTGKHAHSRKMRKLKKRVMKQIVRQYGN
jgi:teichuronic acid biosynthesis glycosyltransferase TuaG